MIETFFIPKSTTNVNTYAFVVSTALKEFIIDPSNPSYSVSDGILFNKAQTYLIRFPPNKSKTYIIPEKVISIAACSFANSIIESIQFSSDFRSIGAWAFVSSKLKSIEIPNTVTTIYDGAFGSCIYLNSVIIGKGITSIPAQCFQRTNISSITIPSGITKIDSYAFDGCNNLKEVVLPSSLKNLGGSCFPSNTNLTFSEGSDFMIDDQMIVYNKAKTIIVMSLNQSDSYIIPSTVEKINIETFISNHNLKTVEFGLNSNLYDIGDKAFFGCDQLSSINIPLTISKLGKYSFSGCNSLQSIFFGENLSMISDKCFDNCISLRTINFVDINVSANISQYAFNGCSSLSSVTLKKGILSLDMFCFRGCTSLNKINIPSTVVFIGTNAFQNTSIETITFSPDSHMRVLNQYVFSGCNTLRSIENIPSGIESIESNCFEFTNLETFTVPVCTVSISDYAFRGCTSLRVFTIPSGCLLSNIGNFIFTGCTSLSVIECDNSEHFVVDNGALFNKERSNLIYFPPASSIKFFCFSQNVKSISSSAFFGCKHLEGIMIPDNSIETIGFSAFSECTSLKYINIPLCVKTIEQNAFSGCINLHCGVNIQNKTRSYIDNIVVSSG
ncbi:regulation of response to stimulus, partial [Trichomonas vaginalis G3]